MKKSKKNSEISFLQKWQQRLEYLRLDNRSLALFRIVLGISVLYSLVFVRLPYAVEIWGESTIIPVEIIKVLNREGSFSIFDWIRSDSFAIAYMYVTILVALLFTIGFYTRYISILLLFLFWNLIQANSAFSFGFDFYTFQLLFWSVFFPLDNFYSIKPTPIKKVSLSFSIALISQIAWIYFATGIAKFGQSWMGGYAIRNMLLDTGSTKLMARFFVDNVFLYKPLTYISLAMEYLAPLFLFIRYKYVWFRYCFVAFLLGFHFFIFMMYKVGNFSISGISVALLLLPPDFWNNVLKINPLKFEVDRFNSKKLQWFRYAFVLIFIYVISIENLKFFTKNSALRRSDNIEVYVDFLSKIDIPSPVKTSFFLQYWKMFAPNPPSKGGWLTLEYVNPNDGYLYDLFTGQLVTDVPQVPYKQYEGMEYYMIYYSRTYIYDEEGFRFRVFLKHWIPYIFKKNGWNMDDYEKLYLTDYVFEITDQSKPFKPRIQKMLLPVDNILEKNDFGDLIKKEKI